GVTVLFTTHNLSTVAEQFDLVAFVNRRIVASGRPADVFSEQTLRATYGPRMALVQVGDRYYAIDVGCAVVGAFVVWKGLSFVGDALAHASFAGVAIAFVTGQSIYLGAAVAA